MRTENINNSDMIMKKVKLETYKETYQRIKSIEKQFIENMLNDIVTYFKTIVLKPVIMGNIVYFYCEENNKDVPAYCYLTDYNEGRKEFKPIYDRNNTMEFGWANIECVISILDALKLKLYNIGDVMLNNVNPFAVSENCCTFAPIKQ